MKPERKRFWSNSGPWMFIFPAFIIYFLFMLIPILGTLGLSFTTWSGIDISNITFVGFENYQSLFQNNIFWIALRNSLIFVVGSVIFQVLLGLVMALLLEKERPFGNFIRGSFFIPSMLALIVVGIVFETLLNPALGILDTIFEGMGLEMFTGIGMLLQTKKAMIVLVLLQVWYGFGWSMFIFISRLKSINPQLYEAAYVDGTSEWQRILYITLPQLKGTFVVAVLFAATWAMKIFTLPFVMTRGGPDHATEVLATIAYDHGLTYNNIGYGSAISMLLIISGTVIGYLVYNFIGKE
ncbi:MAG: carbohydrate ABC transporter permease [Halothermotrichaceae bacterium]